jgi:hypothetical protein
MSEKASIHKKGSWENPFKYYTTMEQALSILMEHALQLPTDGTIVHFNWQGGIYAMDVGCKINHKSESSHALETLRKEMKNILKL